MFLENYQNQNPCRPKCRQGLELVGTKPPGPIWGHLGPFFAWAGKIEKMSKFRLFSLVGQWALFTRFGPMGLVGQIMELMHQTYCPTSGG